MTKVNGINALEMIVKHPMKPMGMAYNGSIMMPFKKYNFLIGMRAVELGFTGMREAAVMDKWMKENGAPESGKDGKLKGWAQDPYLKHYKKGTLMNYAEQEGFDKDFPNHPLSFIRSKLKEVKASISFEEELLNLDKF